MQLCWQTQGCVLWPKSSCSYLDIKRRAIGLQRGDSCVFCGWGRSWHRVLQVSLPNHIWEATGSFSVFLLVGILGTGSHSVLVSASLPLSQGLAFVLIPSPVCPCNLTREKGNQCPDCSAAALQGLWAIDWMTALLTRQSSCPHALGPCVLKANSVSLFLQKQTLNPVGSYPWWDATILEALGFYFTKDPSLL